MASPRVSLILAAGGISQRFSPGQKKQFAKLNGITLLDRCLQTFESCSKINCVVLVTAEDELQKTNSIINSAGFNKIKKIIPGGKERKYSVYNGFKNLPDQTDIVLIHDAARPLITEELTNIIIDSCLAHGACIPAVPVPDTIKSIKENSTVEGTLQRENLRRAQTPQAFRYKILKDTYTRSNLDTTTATDESQLVEQCGYEVKIVEGSETNIKITTQHDLRYAEFLIEEGQAG